MKMQQLGASTIQATRVSYGCMKLGGTWDEKPTTSEHKQKATRAVKVALDAGINFFDHADIYCRGKSESVFAEIIRELGLKRANLFIQTKLGIRFAGDPDAAAPARYDFSYEHIIKSAELSLKRLGTDYIDVYLLHRPDALAEPAEIAKAFDELHRAGKIRWVGVSNHNAGQIALLRKHLKQPILVNQVELSLVHSHLVDSGMVHNQNKQSFGADGTLEYCRLHDITLQAWSPMGGGRAIGSDKDAKAIELAKKVKEIAEKKSVSKDAIALAWILKHPAKIQPIIGSLEPDRIKIAKEADGVELTREEWYALHTAARGERMP